MDAALEFIVKLVPELVALGHELYKVFEGNADEASSVIRAMKAKIVMDRAENDAALSRKYSKE